MEPVLFAPAVNPALGPFLAHWVWARAKDSGSARDSHRGVLPTAVCYAGDSASLPPR